MDLVQSSFQASFNARIERLAEQEAAELRTIFRFFDTDADGVVSADQVCRIFGLLGLDVNRAHVQDLGEVYLNEFMKIVDAHVASTAPPAPPDASTESNQVVVTAVGEGDAANIEQAVIQPHHIALWENEWKVIDSYRRGQVSKHELYQFLRSCFSPFPQHDLDRFLELHGDPTGDEHGSMALTKDGFIKFRRACTLRDLAPPDSESSSDNDDDDGREFDGLALLQQADPTASSAAQDDSATKVDDRPSRRRKMSSSSRTSHLEHDAGGDGFSIDNDVLHDEYVDEDEPSDDASSASIAPTPLPHAELMLLTSDLASE
ncbi:hypothetical protein PINS_up014593 [Pythium insidiosum]|nr:hypothetical protein PINS_up014593 [Pythium insidiosum]